MDRRLQSIENVRTHGVDRHLERGDRTLSKTGGNDSAEPHPLLSRPILANRASSSKKHRLSQAGFTLIEVAVVLVILAVVLGVVIGRRPMRSRGLEVRAAAGMLSQSLRAARAQAISTDQDVFVSIDPARHVFGTDGRESHQIDPGIPIVISESEFANPGGVRIIRFSGDGSSSGGIVHLGTGKAQLRVSVEWLTGKVIVSGVN